MLSRKKEGGAKCASPLSFIGSDDSSELPSVAEQLAQAIAGPPGGIWLVLDEVAVDEVLRLGFELLEAQRVRVEWTAGEVCGEFIGNVVVDERLVALLGTGVVGVADELEPTGPAGVVVE